MKTKTKALVLALCAVLLVVSTVFVTMAYLTAKDSVSNTFTVGKVAITLDEADVKPDGTYKSTKEARVDANEYKLIPGHTYIKDPTIHVEEGSEDCWLFVKVENGLVGAEITAETETSDQNTYNSIENQMKKDDKWVEVGNDIYAYKDKVSAGADVVVFENFMIAANAKVAEYEEAKIIITAYAIQADGFPTAQAAWTAAGDEAQQP